MVQMNRIMGKPLWNAKKISAWGRWVDRSEIQVLTGVNRHHGHTLGIREGSADGDMRGYSLH